MRILFLLVFLASLSFDTQAQILCGSDEHHAYLMKTDPVYAARHTHQKAVLDSIKRAPATPDRQHPPVYTIPIVVHVIHLGEQIGSISNIPDQQIYDAIAGLNERYANTNGLGTDIEINFCLATRDPNGCPTSGINRVDGSAVPEYAENGITWANECGADEGAIKDLSKWPTWEYYNIWVVHDICGDIAGYAYYPNGDEYDGTVIDIASMKYSVGTLSHELGHGLNLHHTFSGDNGNTCPSNNDCMEDGDEICDTPPHRQNDCGLSNPCSSEGEWLNSRDNWMSYCHPSYELGKFTEDQRTRMRNSMSVDPRSSLLSSQGCANEVGMRITSEGSNICSGESRELTAVPEGGYFVIAGGSGIIEGNVLTAFAAPSILVEYIIEQENCTSSVYQLIPVKPTPNSTLKSTEQTLCIGETTLLQGLPAGGTYSVISGPGTIDSNLLTAQDTGWIEVLYEKLLLGCLSKDTLEVKSFAPPIVDIEPLTSDILTAVPDTGEFQWVRCDLGYEPVTDGTDAIYYVSTSGSYAVISTSGFCMDTSDCIDVEITATQDGEKYNEIRIYPNPVNDVLYLEDVSNQNEFVITMTDMRGMPIATKIIQGQRINEMDLSGLTGGVYVLQMNVKGEGRFVYKIVKM